MTIDAHIHLWQRNRGDYGWLTPDAGVLWDDFGPADAERHLITNNIDQAILVQAAPTIAETLFLLDIAKSHSWVAGVVGWIDFDGDEPLADMALIAAHPSLVGVRPMVQDLPNPDWLAQDRHHPIFEALAARSLVFDALVRPIHLPRLIEVADRHPNLTIVLDHAGKPDIANGDWYDWASNIVAISCRPNVVCKLSGLITQASANWTIETLRPIFDVLTTNFGPHRLMWGSDWPVCNLVGSYQDWYQTAQSLLKGLCVSAREEVFDTNVRRIYGIGNRRDL